MLGDFSHMWQEIETMFKRVLNTKLGDTKKVTSVITTDKKNLYRFFQLQHVIASV